MLTKFNFFTKGKHQSRILLRMQAVPDHSKSVYLYTIPKSGTYAVAKLLENLAYHNTGIHLSANSYLDTHSASLSINTKMPGTTNVDKVNYSQVISLLPEGNFLFGHMCPLLMKKRWRKKLTIITGYRHPADALVSEFIDMRFRRDDINWLKTTEIADDREAFLVYLQRHGHIHIKIWGYFIRFHREVTCQSTTDPTVMFFEFDQLRSKVHGPGEIEKIAQFIDCQLNQSQAQKLHKTFLGAKTKTNATDITLKISRSDLWTKQSRSVYEKHGFLAVEEYIEQNLAN